MLLIPKWVTRSLVYSNFKRVLNVLRSHVKLFLSLLFLFLFLFLFLLLLLLLLLSLSTPPNGQEMPSLKVEKLAVEIRWHGCWSSTKKRGGLRLYKSEERGDHRVEGETEALRCEDRAFHEEREIYNGDRCRTAFFSRGKRILSAWRREAPRVGFCPLSSDWECQGGGQAN